MTSSDRLEHCRLLFRKLRTPAVAISHYILVSLLHVYNNLRLYTMGDNIIYLLYLSPWVANTF